jgi:hypothetical protein
MKISTVSLCVLLGAAYPAGAGDPGAEFFEKKIRPLLVEHCYACHSKDAKKQRGGLLLDTRAGLRKGGETGPAIVPGKPKESLLIKAVRHLDPELKMPRDGKLSEAAIADLEQWIAMGAPDPRDDDKGAKAIDWTSARRHWSFQPIREPDLPAVKNTPWASSPIDRFIAAKLEDKGLSPSPPADPRTLLRRIHYDLIGLPPSPEEVAAFQKAAIGNPQSAIENVIDHLLASPHYGERWGRHWLDVARYADTKDGVLMFGDDRVRPYAYTYRDYVIKAFNEDLPFDRFIHEQLAADQIEPKVESWRLAAMGFLTLGRMFDNNIHDVLDDRIDVVTRGFLGLTVSCARCHDHKYDPIPTADYYSLYGVFASCEAPLELPLIGRPEDHPGHAEFEKKAGPQREKINNLLEQQFKAQTDAARSRVGDYLLRVATTPPDPLETAIFFLSLAPEDLRPQIVHRWRRYLADPDRATDPVFGPWPDFMKLSDVDFATVALKVQTYWLGKDKGTLKGQLNPLVYTELAKAKLASKADVARLYGGLLSRVQGPKGPSEDNDAVRQLISVVTSPDSPAFFPKSQTYYYMSRGEKDNYGGLLSGLDKIAVQFPKAPPRAMTLHDAAMIYQPRIFQRGNAAVLGEAVPRRFLEIIEGDKRKPFAHGSGRLDLAKAITAPGNPLTARVIANRVWMHHFGESLVANPSDFGTRTAPPLHMELLDYLATTLMKDGWSLKKLHRRIILSSAYQQASWDRAECRQVDPENKFYWRANRRRLDLESMRDTMLAGSGRLDRTQFGRPVDVVNDSNNRRRTVYGLVDRQTLPGLFRAFDFASPDQSAERRPTTTVPQQALFAMNSPFMMEQAKALAARAEKSNSPEERVHNLFQLALGRAADKLEVEAALQFLETKGDRSQLTRWQQLAQVVLLTNEMMFVD